MDHPQAVRTLQALMPDIRKAGDPVPVLLKAAQENRWAPAQLEKLGNVFNTFRTVFHLKEASDRGDSFPLLDVSALVDSYIDKHVAQPARTRPDLTAWFETPHTKAASDEPAVTNVQRQLPNVMRELGADTPFSKAAAAPMPELEDHSGMDVRRQLRKEAAEADVIQRDFDTTRDLVVELHRKAIDMLHKTAHTHIGHWGEVLQDFAQHPQVELVKEAFDLYCDGMGFTPNEAPGEDGRRYIDDRHQARELFEKTADALLDWNIASDMLVENFQKMASTGTATGRSRTPAMASQILSGDSRQTILTDPFAAAQARFAGAGTPQPNGAQGSAGIGNTAGGPAAAGLVVLPGEFEPSAEERASAEQVVRDRARQIQEMRGTAEDLGQTPARLADAYGQEVDSHTTRIEELLNAISPDKNEKQRKVDRAQQEATQQALIQRLIITDDIISKADPNAVLEIYNTLRYLDPDMASDPNTTKLILREALQYEGLPTHVVNETAARRKAMGDARTRESDLTSKKYNLP